MTFKVERAIKLLITTDLMVNTANGFLAPVFAVFVTQKIAPGEIKVVGLAIAIQWLIKSIVQIPLARRLDGFQGESTNLKTIISGTFIMGIGAILYIFIRTPLALYLLQALWGLGLALYAIPWLTTFTRHLNVKKANFEWSISSSLVGFGLVAATALGGFLADKIGFSIVFIMTAVFNFGAGLILIFLHKFSFIIIFHLY